MACFKGCKEKPRIKVEKQNFQNFSMSFELKTLGYRSEVIFNWIYFKFCV